jgi:hypothetical protein
MPLTLTRSLLVILIPGLIALAPWLLWLIADFKNPERYYKDAPELVWVALFVSAAVVGSFLESLNSWIEVYWDDRKKRRGQGIDGDWYDYLARICSTQPVGYGYLSRMVTTMYFELAMAWAVLSFGLGIAVLLDLGTRSRWYVVLTIGIAVMASGWFYISAKASHGVLCKTRREINERLGPIRAR